MSDEIVKDIDTTPDVQMQDVIRDADERAPRAKGKTFFRKKVCRFCAQKAKVRGFVSSFLTCDSA